MPITIQLSLSPQQASSNDIIHYEALKKANLDTSEVQQLIIKRKSIDARQKEVKFIVQVVLILSHEQEIDYSLDFFRFQDVSNAREVVIIGAGPGGLFAALQLIELGIKPVIFEQGKPVEERKKDIAILNKSGVLNPISNWCFGEGGAGTYSDGKLYTRSTKRGNVTKVLNTLCQNGASSDILTEAHPHIGTDKLSAIIRTIREKIIAYGGEVHFNKKLTDITISGDKIKAITLNHNEVVPCEQLILATGHSSRELYHLLYEKGVEIQAKPFALGVRLEHPQAIIDKMQYRGVKHDSFLPPATYAIKEQINGKGVFSFCMCPGGIIVPAATAKEELVLNGMSNSKRNQPLANAGFVVEVGVKDIPIASTNPLALMQFQQQIERACYAFGGDNITAPAQRMTDFVNQKHSQHLPNTSYHPGVISCNLDELLPDFIHTTLRNAIRKISNKKRYFYTEEALMLAVESRTSSPIQIPRHRESLQHIRIKGLYPCAEGAGYAGGIVSSAIDGVRCAFAISKQEKLYY